MAAAASGQRRRPRPAPRTLDAFVAAGEPASNAAAPARPPPPARSQAEASRQTKRGRARPAQDVHACHPLTLPASPAPASPLAVVVEGAAPAPPPPKPSPLRREIMREQQAAPAPGPDAEAGPPQHRRRPRRRRAHPPPGDAAAGGAAALPPDARAHVQRVLDESPRCRTDRSVPREYCAQLPAAALDAALATLLGTLMRFQQRQAHRKPTMAKARRRLLLGLRQCLRASQAGRLKALVLATNLEAYGAPARSRRRRGTVGSCQGRDAAAGSAACLSRAGQRRRGAPGRVRRAQHSRGVRAQPKAAGYSADATWTARNGQSPPWLTSKTPLAASAVHRRGGGGPATAGERRGHPPRRRRRGPAA